MRTARSRSSFGNVVPRGIGSSSNLRASTIPGALHTQSLLKTSGAGQGFRRMKPASGVPLRVLFVDDMVDLNPFEGASNRTAVIVVQKGQETTYPVSYNHWSKKRSGRVPEDASLDEVLAMCRVRQLVALPVDPDDVTSSWISGRRRSLGAVRKVLGPADYQARAGASTWMNGVYWLRVEADLVYPLLRAGDTARWCAAPKYSILMVQDPKKRRGYDEDWLKTRYPKTYAYLARFREALESRSGYKRYFDAGDPFYSMFNVADYTFAKHKVVFPSIGDELLCSVVSMKDAKPFVPQHIVTMVALDDEDEAHFVCACMNSTPARLTLEAYSQKGGKSFATPQVMEHVRVPAFDRAQ